MGQPTLHLMLHDTKGLMVQPLSHTVVMSTIYCYNCVTVSSGTVVAWQWWHLAVLQYCCCVVLLVMLWCQEHDALGGEALFQTIAYYNSYSSGYTTTWKPDKRIGQALRNLLCGARPYVSIVWRSAICFYCVGLGHMFLLCGARPYVKSSQFQVNFNMFLLCGAQPYVSIMWC